MASPEVDIATGCSISFTGLAGLNAREILDFKQPAVRALIEDVSNQASTVGHKKIARDLKEFDNLTLVLHHFQDYDYPADVGTKAAITLTLPSGATVAFYGILEEYDPQEATLNEKMVANVSIAVSADTAATPSETFVITAAP
jgi:hypothetical protein